MGFICIKKNRENKKRWEGGLSSISFVREWKEINSANQQTLRRWNPSMGTKTAKGGSWEEWEAHMFRRSTKSRANVDFPLPFHTHPPPPKKKDESGAKQYFKDTKEEGIIQIYKVSFMFDKWISYSFGSTEEISFDDEILDGRTRNPSNRDEHNRSGISNPAAGKRMKRGDWLEETEGKKRKRIGGGEKDVTIWKKPECGGGGDE